LTIYNLPKMSLNGQTWRFVQKRGSPMTKQRRDRRSQRTQQALIEALIALLAVKSYNEISINEIIERANVGRSTFYVHYQTKDDLLKSGFERALDMLSQHISFSEADQGLRLDTTLFFRHAQGHYEIYRTLVWGTGFEVLTRDGHAALSAKFQESFTRFLSGRPEPSIPLAVISYSMAGTLLILLKWWLDHKMPYAPEYMDEIFQRLVMSSAREVLGLIEIRDK
jgi:AcrR family transcriptional regulator